MTATEEKYIEIMRKKTGEERLRISFELRKIVLKLAEASIRSKNPKITPKILFKKLQERIYGFGFNSQNSGK